MQHGKDTLPIGHPFVSLRWLLAFFSSVEWVGGFLILSTVRIGLGRGLVNALSICRFIWPSGYLHFAVFKLWTVTMDITLQNGMVQSTAAHAQRVLCVRWDRGRLESGASRAPSHHTLVVNLRSIFLVTWVYAGIMACNSCLKSTANITIAWMHHGSCHLSTTSLGEW